MHIFSFLKEKMVKIWILKIKIFITFPLGILKGGVHIFGPAFSLLGEIPKILGEIFSWSCLVEY